jgi:hypothetical protein
MNSDYYKEHVEGKTAEQILADAHSADSVRAAYLQIASQVRSQQALVGQLKEASKDSSIMSRRIAWLTAALVLVGVLQAAATVWSHR